MRKAKEPFQSKGQQNVTAQSRAVQGDIPQGLYRENFEHDNCGIGAVVNKDGRKSHLTVERALHIVEGRWCMYSLADIRQILSESL